MLDHLLDREALQRGEWRELIWLTMASQRELENMTAGEVHPDFEGHLEVLLRFLENWAAWLEDGTDLTKYNISPIMEALIRQRIYVLKGSQRTDLAATLREICADIRIVQRDFARNPQSVDAKTVDYIAEVCHLWHDMLMHPPIIRWEKQWQKRHQAEITT